MAKTWAKILLGFLLILTVFGIGWTQDLQQVNKETLFLTEDAISSYESFQETFQIKSLILGGFPHEKNISDETLWKKIDEKASLYCQKHCQLLGPNQLKLPEGPHQSLKLIGKELVGYLIVANEDSSDGDFKAEVKKLLSDPLFEKHSFSGVPYTNILLDKYSLTVKKVIFPALFVGIFIMLMFFLKNLIGAIVVFIPGLMGASFSLSLTKIFYGHSNLITSIIPLLLFVIQMSLALHIFCTGVEENSLKSAIKDKREPTFLMVLTTFIGFGSLTFSPLYAISQFGLMTAILLLLTTVTNLLWLMLVSLNKDQFSKTKEGKWLSFLHGYFEVFWNKRSILIVSFLSLLLGGIALPNIRIITDATEYFPEDTGIKTSMEKLSKDIMGTPVLEVTIKEKEGDLDFSLLQKINKVEENLRSTLSGNIISSNELVKLGNYEYAKEFKLPPDRFAYYGIKSKVPPLLASGYPTEDSYRMTYLDAPMNVDHYEEKLAIFEKEFKKENIQYEFNGLYYHLMEAQKVMIGTLFKSFFLSLIIICTIAFLYFRDGKLFFTFMLVNIIPVFASFPFLYLFGLTFNIATVMTYSISLGLVVDSSFHIIHALKKGIGHHQYQEGVQKPILGASLLLALCFFLFGLSDFLPIRQFGLCLAIVILLGMFSDLKLLPFLLTKETRLKADESV